MTLKQLAVGAVMALAGSLAAGGGAQAALIGPLLPYDGFSDSPFFGKSFSYFHLETFEEGALTAPGVAASAGVVVGPGEFVDSVDGGGPAGHSFFNGCGSCGITFSFDAGVLGKLPTSVGIVWTDGDGPDRHFEAFDEHGASLGTITDGSPLFFSSGGDGDAANYRFFGVTNPGGVSSIFISNDGGGIEVDHLQYGAARGGVPEPVSWALMIGGFGLAGATLRRRRTVVAA
jgi:hypothetical protein